MNKDPKSFAHTVDTTYRIEMFVPGWLYWREVSVHADADLAKACKEDLIAKLPKDFSVRMRIVTVETTTTTILEE
jgi:hypothetical protein